MPYEPISARAVAFIETQEITDQTVYKRVLAHLNWPQGASGITGGIGYDFGYTSSKQIIFDWSAILPADIIDRLIKLSGFTGASAQAMLASVKDIVIPYDAALHVFQNRDIPRYFALMQATFPNPHRIMPADAGGALTSLVQNRGGNWSDTPTRREMYLIHDALLRDTVSLVGGYIRSMKRLWTGVPGMEGLLNRRDGEAAMYDASLQEAPSPPFVATAPFVDYRSPAVYVPVQADYAALAAKADSEDAAIEDAIARLA